MSVLFNCHEATLLLEKQAEQPLTLAQRLSLRLHLMMCVLCRRYARQTELLAQLARRLGRGDLSNEAVTAERLSAEARARLEQLVRAAGPSGPAAQ